MNNDVLQQPWQRENTKNRKTEPTIQMATRTTAANTIPLTKATTLPETTKKQVSEQYHNNNNKYGATQDNKDDDNNSNNHILDKKKITLMIIVTKIEITINE